MPSKLINFFKKTQSQSQNSTGHFYVLLFDCDCYKTWGKKKNIRQGGGFSGFVGNSRDDERGLLRITHIEGSFKAKLFEVSCKRPPRSTASRA